MIAFLSTDELGPVSERECSPVARVRDQLKRSHGRRDNVNDPRLRTDVKTLMARLRKIRSRGGAFASVGFSEHVASTVESLKMVGSEMLVLQPERRGA